MIRPAASTPRSRIAWVTAFTSAGVRPRRRSGPSRPRPGRPRPRPRRDAAAPCRTPAVPLDRLPQADPLGGLPFASGPVGERSGARSRSPPPRGARQRHRSGRRISLPRGFWTPCLEQSDLAVGVQRIPIETLFRPHRRVPRPCRPRSVSRSARSHARAPRSAAPFRSGHRARFRRRACGGWSRGTLDTVRPTPSRGRRAGRATSRPCGRSRSARR